MPIYEYECRQCQRTFEVLQKFSEPPLKGCILCDGGPVKKLISASAFVLKGTGFYMNDYPSEGRKKGLESEKSGNSEKKSDSQSEPKSDSAKASAAVA